MIHAGPPSSPSHAFTLLRPKARVPDLSDVLLSLVREEGWRDMICSDMNAEKGLTFQFLKQEAPKLRAAVNSVAGK